jgi:hypothetical protein
MLLLTLLLGTTALLLQATVSFKAGRHNHSGLELHRQTIRLIRAAAVTGIVLLPLTKSLYSLGTSGAAFLSEWRLLRQPLPNQGG